MKKKFNVEKIKKKVISRYPLMVSLIDNVELKVFESQDAQDTAFTDGKSIYFNSKFLDTLDEKEQVFVFAHELAHIALDHIMRSDGKDPYLWNIATDAVINQELLRDRLSMPEGCINIKEALSRSAEWVYKKLEQKRQELQQKNAENGQGNQNDNDQPQNSQGGQGGQGNQNGQGQSSQNSQGGQGGQSGQGNHGQSGQSGQQSGQSGQSGGTSSQNAQNGQGQSDGQGEQRGQDALGSDQSGNGGSTGDGNIKGKKSQGRSGIKNKKPTSIDDMDLSDFQENISNHGKWADAVKKAKEAETRKKEQENNSQSNNNQQAEKNKDDQNPRIDGKDKDIKTDGKSASQEKHEVAKGEMNKDKNNQDQSSKSKKADKEQRKKDKKLNKRKLKDTKFGGEVSQYDQQNTASIQDQNNRIDREEKDDNSQNQNHENRLNQNNQSEDEEKTDRDQQDQGIVKPVSNNEEDFFSKNREKVREYASKITSDLASKAFGMGNPSAIPSGTIFSNVGQAQAVVRWDKLLKKNLPTQKVKWDDDEFQDSNDTYVRRVLRDADKYEKAGVEVICDVSGSVSHELIKCFLRQIKSMITKDTELRIGFFADYFYGWYTGTKGSRYRIKKKSDIDNLVIPKGGGTDFDSASRAFSTYPNVTKICFTDGCDGGDARIVNKRKDIIWISFGNRYFKPDYGKVIYVPEEKIYETDITPLGGNNSFNDNDRNI